jgi:serpin B
MNEFIRLGNGAVGRKLVLIWLLIVGTMLATPGRAQATREPSTDATLPLVRANNSFAFELYRQIAPTADQNAFFSPYSISTALAMTWAGAHGNTAAQMASVLHIDALKAENVAPAFGVLQKSLAEEEKQSGVQLAVANSLWPEQNPEIPLRPEYIKLVQESFGSAIFPVDYKSQAEAARQRINQWVESKTNQRIQNLLAAGQVTDATRLILVNAIYFKGNWAEKFDAQATTPAPFQLSGVKTVSTPFMHKSFARGEAGYAEISGTPAPLQILVLPYQGKSLQMVMLLPKSPSGVADLEKNLTAEQWESWLGQLRWDAKVEVALPKFKLNARYGLTSPLQALGMTDAFNATQADFSGMTKPSYLSISDVVHQAFVEVNEEGTEAAAATGVIMSLAMEVAGPTPVFRADHPFLFLIRDQQSGTILFMGRLASPEAAK